MTSGFALANEKVRELYHAAPEEKRRDIEGPLLDIERTYTLAQGPGVSSVAARAANKEVTRMLQSVVDKVGAERIAEKVGEIRIDLEKEERFAAAEETGQRRDAWHLLTFLSQHGDGTDLVRLSVLRERLSARETRDLFHEAVNSIAARIAAAVRATISERRNLLPEYHKLVLELEADSGNDTVRQRFVELSVRLDALEDGEQRHRDIGEAIRALIGSSRSKKI